MEEKTTIAAIATAMSDAGISIVRVSGDEAVSAVDQIFRSKRKQFRLRDAKTHTVHYGIIMDGEQMVDEVLVTVMKAPHTYTREDVVEINCHGGVTVTRRVLETVLKHGVRTALPGEFTKRAFLNGRIDLSQAEAVIDIIHSKNEYALQSSVQQLNGTMKRKISSIREKIIRDLAFIEAALDDPEHIEIDGFDEELSGRIEEELKELKRLLSTAESGRILKEGIRTAIVGKPNAGKSSLLNLLAGQTRAIVTDVAGTTRDVLEETVLLSGIMLVLMDTAGIRQTEDQVEKIGVELAKKSVQEADLVLFVLDASRELSKEDREIAEMIQEKPVIVLWNKTDLTPAFAREDFEECKDRCWIPFSAKEEQGLEELTEQIRSMFYDGKVSFNDEVYITNVRHKEAVASAIGSLEAVQESIENGMPEDFFSIDLMNAYEALGEIIGEAVDDDLVETVFKEFCMGK
jgi:tRNA modification GTPase